MDSTVFMKRSHNPFLGEQGVVGRFVCALRSAGPDRDSAAAASEAKPPWDTKSYRPMRAMSFRLIPPSKRVTRPSA